MLNICYFFQITCFQGLLKHPVGGGVIPLEIPPVSYRLFPIDSIFHAAESVCAGFDREDQLQLTNAYHEFRELESNFKRNSFSAFTDGSFSKDLDEVGCWIWSGHLSQQKCFTGDHNTNWMPIYHICRITSFPLCPSVVKRYRLGPLF